MPVENRLTSESQNYKTNCLKNILNRYFLNPNPLLVFKSTPLNRIIFMDPFAVEADIPLNRITQRERVVTWGMSYVTNFSKR